MARYSGCEELRRPIQARGGGEALAEIVLSSPLEIDGIRFVHDILFGWYKCRHICTGWWLR
jgi:hypothetical protein